MPTKGEAGNSLKRFGLEFGVPEFLTFDVSKELCLEQRELNDNAQYGGVAFKRVGDAKAWIKYSVDNGEMEFLDASLIVDPHMVLEHVYANLVGDDFLHRFEKLNKLHIDTLAQ